MRSMSERLLIVGWDGADWEVLDDLLERGQLPNLAEMLRDGARGELESTRPTHSWAAWPSFLTGLHPSGHGVFDFIERDPREPQRRIPVSSSSIKATTFVERLSDAGLEVRMANVPVTFPPIPVRGRMISGVALPPRSQFVYPAEWQGELQRRAPFPINGMEWNRFRDRPEALIDEARHMVLQRTTSYEVLLEGPWDLAVCVYVASDRLQHPLGSSLLPSHPRFDRDGEGRVADRLRGVYAALDGSLGRLRTIAGDRTTTVLLSDHGFRPITRAADLNRLLERLGFAAVAGQSTAVGRLRRSGIARRVLRTRIGRSVKAVVRAPSTVDWRRTVAYQSATGGGVSINVRGREPNGIVSPEEYQRAIEQVRDAILGYRDPQTGERIADDVLVRDALPDGPHRTLAPDLLIGAAPLWAFLHTGTVSSETTWPSGTHRKQGVIAASGPAVQRGDLGKRQLVDVAPTALAFFGITADGLDGRPIAALVEQRPAHDGAQVGSSGGSEVRRDPSGMSEADEEYVAQHLRDLGYIE
jgi:predicted AlkP superfamily phosphohydrolase/phosphomutase